MRTSMTYPIRFWAVVLIILLAYQFTSEASADWCKYEKDIDLTLDVADSHSLAITAAAGELEVIGVSGTDEAVISGKVCASKEEWLEEVSRGHFELGKAPWKVLAALTAAFGVIFFIPPVAMSVLEMAVFLRFLPLLLAILYKNLHLNKNNFFDNSVS